MGGMGRTINGSYATYTNVRGTNVVPIETDLSWEAAVATGIYQAKPSRVYFFDEIKAAHQLMDSGNALGKIVVRL